MVLNRSLVLLQGSGRVIPGPITTNKLTQYANFLASQGKLATAMSFLPSDCDQVSGAVRESKLFHSVINADHEAHVSVTVLMLRLLE